MQQIQKFDIKSIPVEKIVFVLTSDIDYSMERIIFVEHWEDYGNYLILQGSHCSCYDFDEADWDATIVDEEELKKLLEGWDRQETGLEPQMAKLLRDYFNWRV